MRGDRTGPASVETWAARKLLTAPSSASSSRGPDLPGSPAVGARRPPTLDAIQAPLQAEPERPRPGSVLPSRRPLPGGRPQPPRHVPAYPLRVALARWFIQQEVIIPFYSWDAGVTEGDRLQRQGDVHSPEGWR